jgi:hypothetical protein
LPNERHRQAVPHVAQDVLCCSQFLKSLYVGLACQQGECGKSDRIVAEA